MLRSARSRRTAWLAARLKRLDADELAQVEAALPARPQAARRRRVTQAFLRANRRTFTSLRKHRNYRLFFSGQVVSVSGTWMQNIATAWLILSLTHSPVAVGVLALCQFLPFTLFGLFAGVLVDRFDPRKTVIATQAVVARLRGRARGADARRDRRAVAGLPALGAPRRGARRRRAGAAGAHVPMVGRDELPNAVALNSSLFNAARVIGPAAGGIVVAAAGVGFCFAFNAVELPRRARRAAADAAVGDVPDRAARDGADAPRRDARGARVRRAAPGGRSSCSCSCAS